MYCPQCGSQLEPEAVLCGQCGAVYARYRASDLSQDQGLAILLPVGRSLWAIAAGYLGLFSVLIVFAPFALVCGWLALRDIKANPEKLGKGRAIFGIVMGALGTLVLALGLALGLIGLIVGDR